ncbi:MAG: DUF6531 domain-containing protein [Psychrosphaera sp.]|nr:DUF6531 domain-containing protein [Psychrosphaera sp.]
MTKPLSVKSLLSVLVTCCFFAPVFSACASFNHSNNTINTFITNEQSVFNGTQKGYVNVGKGNVTFIHQDLVTEGNFPILMSRVYDSSLGNNSDFGLGWQLSLNESIVPSKEGALLYHDGCATVHRLNPANVGFSVDPAENGDIRSVTLNAHGVLQLGYLDGKQKQFKMFGKQYLLISVLDQYSNRIELSYNNNRLSKVSGNHGQSIDIKRDDKGRISLVTDNNNRFVTYHYSQQGLLDTVDDLTGFSWHYQYHGNGLLHKVVDPTGHLAAMFRFNKDNRASTVKIGNHKHSYRYQGVTTLVKDAKGKTTTFVQSTNGITTTVTNTKGFVSRIVLNK